MNYCRICGSKQELEKRGRDLRDVHECKPKGCPVASSIYTLADGQPCPDPRHKENKCTSS